MFFKTKSLFPRIEAVQAAAGLIIFVIAGYLSGETVAALINVTRLYIFVERRFFPFGHTLVTMTGMGLPLFPSHEIAIFGWIGSDPAAKPVPRISAFPFGRFLLIVGASPPWFGHLKRRTRPR